MGRHRRFRVMLYCLSFPSTPKVQGAVADYDANLLFAFLRRQHLNSAEQYRNNTWCGIQSSAVGSWAAMSRISGHHGMFCWLPDPRVASCSCPHIRSTLRWWTTLPLWFSQPAYRIDTLPDGIHE